MSGVGKIIDKMTTCPNGIRFSEIHKVLDDHGYSLVRTNGSHNHFRNKAGDVITIRKSNPLKAVYVKDVLSRLGS